MLLFTPVFVYILQLGILTKTLVNLIQPHSISILPSKYIPRRKYILRNHDQLNLISYLGKQIRPWSGSSGFALFAKALKGLVSLWGKGLFLMMLDKCIICFDALHPLWIRTCKKEFFLTKKNHTMVCCFQLWHMLTRLICTTSVRTGKTWTV